MGTVAVGQGACGGHATHPPTTEVQGLGTGCAELPGRAPAWRLLDEDLCVFLGGNYCKVFRINSGGGGCELKCLPLE